VARIRISKDYRKLLADKIMDLGNLILGGLTLGQFISGNKFSLELFLTGFILMIICYAVSFLLSNIQ